MTKKEAAYVETRLETDLSKPGLALCRDGLRLVIGNATDPALLGINKEL